MTFSFCNIMSNNIYTDQIYHKIFCKFVLKLFGLKSQVCINKINAPSKVFLFNVGVMPEGVLEVVHLEASRVNLAVDQMVVPQMAVLAMGVGPCF